MGQVQEIEFPAHWELRTQRRHYIMRAYLDLLGSPTLERRWQGYFTKRGGGKTEKFTSVELLCAKVNQVLGVRRRHGYVSTSIYAEDEAQFLTKNLNVEAKKEALSSQIQQETTQNHPMFERAGNMFLLKFKSSPEKRASEPLEASNLAKKKGSKAPSSPQMDLFS